MRNKLQSGSLFEHFEKKCEAMRIGDMRDLIRLLDRDLNHHPNPWSLGFVNLCQYRAIAVRIFKEKTGAFRKMGPIE